jgi:hypothetical protein
MDSRVNQSYSFEYGGKKFFAKKGGGYGGNDVIAAQVGRILGLSVLPVVTRGPYMVTPWIQKPNFIRASADAQTIIDKMSESEKTRETVGQYLLADPDRHGGNFLVDKEAGKIYDIDLGGSFKGNDAGGTVGTNAFVQMAYRTYGGKGPWNFSAKLDRGVLQDLADKSEQVLSLLGPLHFSENMSRRFDIVAKLAMMDEPTLGDFHELVGGWY